MKTFEEIYEQVLREEYEYANSTETTELEKSASENEDDS
jgi:hypothetical protein